MFRRSIFFILRAESASIHTFKCQVSRFSFSGANLGCLHLLEGIYVSVINLYAGLYTQTKMAAALQTAISLVVELSVVDGSPILIGRTNIHTYLSTYQPIYMTTSSNTTTK